jgi:hypothetical protein
MIRRVESVKRWVSSALMDKFSATEHADYFAHGHTTSVLELLVKLNQIGYDVEIKIKPARAVYGRFAFSLAEDEQRCEQTAERGNGAIPW